jgi:hypothetical protein
MPEAHESGQDVFDVSLDAEEADMLDKHAELWGLSKEEAMADLVDFALASVVESKGPTDTGKLFADDKEYSEVKLSIEWPETGPFGDMNESDKAFASSVLSISLREALTVILYKKIRKEKDYGLEGQS